MTHSTVKQQLETGNRHSDEIAEAQQKKWQILIESTYFTHSIRKTCKTINKLSTDYAQPQQQCNVTADQVPCQLLLNGKGNSTHRPSKARITDNHITEHSLTSQFTMEELMKGIKILNNNKAAGLDDMLCEQIKNMGTKAMVRLKEMMNNILVSKKFQKLWRKSKVIAILKPDKDSSIHKGYRPISLLCHTYKLLEHMMMNRLNHITEHTIIKEQTGLSTGKSCKANYVT